MKLCHLIHSLGPGGAEDVLVDLAEAAPRAGIDMSVVSLVHRPDAADHIAALRARGAAVSSCNVSSILDPRAFARFRKHVRQHQPHVIHTHLKHADFVGGVVGRSLGVPMVSTMHLIEDAVTPVGRAKRWLGAQARVHAADVTISVSDALRDWYLDTFKVDPDRVVTVRNGVTSARIDPETRPRLRTALGISESTLVLVNLAMMRPGKGQDQLIDALRRVPSSLDICVLLAGDGTERPALEARARAVDPDGTRIRFLGYRQDVPELLSASDVVIHPSLFDALPTALIHALAYGRPAIASDVGGIPEIVGSEAGILVAPGRPELLADAIVALANDPEKRDAMSTAARSRFANEFDADVWVSRLRRIYDSVTRSDGVLAPGSEAS
jgi:glycosyltransferase involved in cell wall biosynthesis